MVGRRARHCDKEVGVLRRHFGAPTRKSLESERIDDPSRGVTWWVLEDRPGIESASRLMETTPASVFPNQIRALRSGSPSGALKRARRTTSVLATDVLPVAHLRVGGDLPFSARRCGGRRSRAETRRRRSPNRNIQRSAELPHRCCRERQSETRAHVGRREAAARATWGSEARSADRHLHRREQGRCRRTRAPSLTSQPAKSPLGDDQVASPPRHQNLAMGSRERAAPGQQRSSLVAASRR